MNKKDEKNKLKKESKSILNILIPDHLRKVNKNSDWCKTGKIPSKFGKKR